MSNSLERYRKLELKESFSRTYHYPLACKELSFILRSAYNRLPKNVQSLIFQDTLAAFLLLPEMQTKSAISAANLLLQSAEAALPKQKRNLAVKEFKHAKVAHKRRGKTPHEEGLAQLHQDVLVHIFSFLDMRSLASAALVCWSWNFAATDNHLWQRQYVTFFSSTESRSKVEKLQSGGLVGTRGHTLEPEDNVASDSMDWREAFRRVYEGNTSKKFTTSRGYCGPCNAIVWLNNMKCYNKCHGLKSEKQPIKPVSLHQVVEYLLGKSPSVMSSSDSDSDSDGVSILKLWAYARKIKE